MRKVKLLKVKFLVIETLLLDTLFFLVCLIVINIVIVIIFIDNLNVKIIVIYYFSEYTISSVFLQETYLYIFF